VKRTSAARTSSVTEMANLDASSIVKRYLDACGHWRHTTQETRAAILDAMGPQEPRREQPVLVAYRGRRKRLRGPAEVTLEDGSVLRVETSLPPDLPLGYHRLRSLDVEEHTRLIISPKHCYLPEDLRVWGWSVQLYALRSRQSWGIGDFADLRRLADWSASQLGAGILLVNPLQAASPILPQQPSPYFPTSRCYWNLVYLRIEEIPGATQSRIALEPLARAGVALNHEQRIDRDTVFKLKMEALQTVWRSFVGDPAFDRFCREQGDALIQFARFCVLAEHYGRGWRQWPLEHQHPDSSAVARFAADHADRVRFHQWVQWLLDQQLARAAAKIPLVQDLPIGVDPDGADAWAWQDLFARRVTVGSPPDRFNTHGQDWGLPPFIPWKLRDRGYEPFIQTIRRTLRHAGSLRIDHVMGLFRLFWIPEGALPGAGAYVRYPVDELLAILALESERAKAYIVGEDLGTVDESARKRLAAFRILSYRLLWFEADPPGHYPQQALAAVTTHDLPTIAGLWTGADLRAQRELGLNPNEEGTQEIRKRLSTMIGIPDDSPIDEVIERTHQLLAQAPSAIVAATLEDALAVQQRPNMPATTSERWPNWSMALPESQEKLEHNTLVRAVAEALATNRVGHATPA
jgi:4-alpha-glucanotransferase